MRHFDVGILRLVWHERGIDNWLLFVRIVMHVRVDRRAQSVFIVPHAVFLGCFLPLELPYAQLLADNALRCPHLLEQVMNVIDLLEAFVALAKKPGFRASTSWFAAAFWRKLPHDSVCLQPGEALDLHFFLAIGPRHVFTTCWIRRWVLIADQSGRHEALGTLQGPDSRRNGQNDGAETTDCR